MSIRFAPPLPPPKPSLAQRIGIDGKIRFLKQNGFWISAEDNDPEYVSVRFVIA